MAKLIFLLDGNVIKEYLLDKERMTIGRRASNDIYIDNLAISGEHAILVTERENTYLEDLNSTNGTLVNQNRVKKQVLKHGDEIGLGKYTLKFLNDGIANAASNGFSDTVLVEPKSTVNNDSDNVEAVPVYEASVAENPPEQEEAVEESTSVSEHDEPNEQHEVSVEDSSNQTSELTTEEVGAVSLGPHLKTLSGEQVDSVLLLDKTMVKVGQPGEQVAVVTKRQDGYFITHVAGDHYPIINGEAIGAKAYALNKHDEVEVMGVKMEFRLD